MQGPMLLPPRRVADSIDLLPGWLPLPGLGLLPINAFVVHGATPLLVDTGLAALRSAFMEALAQVVEPAALKWIWITHTDADHVGNLAAVLAAAPQARVVTTYFGMGKMGLLGLPLERCFLLNPGQSLDLGGRTVTALVPPVFDAPETTALWDETSRTLISADCFGAPLPQPADTAAAVAPDALRDGMRLWASIDAPWLRMVERLRWDQALAEVARLEPQTVLSSHLPPATAMTATLLANLADAPDLPRFVGEAAALNSPLPPPQGSLSPDRSRT